MDKKEEYIEKFAVKHGTFFDRFVDPEQEVIKFNNGMFFELKDIIHDIDRNLPVWAAKEYHREGLEGIVITPYHQWYETRNI